MEQQERKQRQVKKIPVALHELLTTVLEAIGSLDVWIM